MEGVARISSSFIVCFMEIVMGVETILFVLFI